MDYLEQVRKEISHHTGLTGVEAGHLVHKMEKQGIDYQSFDWKTMGENMYGHGHRTGGLNKVMKGMYSMNLEENISDEHEFLEKQVLHVQSHRSPLSLNMDNHINAKHVFKMSNHKGVKKWLKAPNMFDIVGIDDIIKI
jgi:hypothetical protein